MAGRVQSRRVIQQEDDLTLPSSPLIVPRRSVPLSPAPLLPPPSRTDPPEELQQLPERKSSSPSATPRGRRTTSFFLYPSPPASPAVSRRLVSPPPPVTTAASTPSPSSPRSMSPTLSPLQSPRPIDRRRSNSTHVVVGGSNDAEAKLGSPSPPNRLVPPLPPPRRRRSSPHVGKVFLPFF